jgi:hypothetical protein
MTEITERFFQEIAARVGYYKVAELHLFPPIRQGGQESGIAVIAATPETAPAQSGVERHVVYTARYRQTLKGPDRGKWEFDIKAEADAPLITVDEVVRGVVQRSGDDVHPERITGDQFRESVPVPEGQEPPTNEESETEVAEGEGEIEGASALEEGDTAITEEAPEELNAAVENEEGDDEVLDTASSDIGDVDADSCDDAEEFEVTALEQQPEDPEQEQASQEPDDIQQRDTVHA